MLWLQQRGLIAVEGAEALAFLNSITTNQIKIDSPTYTALLTPQGRYLFDFFCIPTSGGFYIDVAANRIPALIQTLIRYRLRRAITFTDISAQWKILVGTDTPPAHSYQDPRHEKMGWRALVSMDTTISETLSTEAYHERRIRLLIPETELDLIPEQTFPLEANLDRCYAISFTKGCYIGQELTARMQHRGLTKKRLYCLRGKAPFASHHRDLLYHGEIIGQRFSTSGCYMLALLRIDHPLEPILCGDVSATIFVETTD